MLQKRLKVGVVGGLGLMASPMARHWKNNDVIKVVRVHDRGSTGERRNRCRQAWKENGAELVDTFEALVGEGNLDGIIVCCGKNGDDLAIIASLTKYISQVSAGAFICHMSTVSTGFVKAADQFCNAHKVRYVNYPLTGGAVGAENATMLILASGDNDLYKQLAPVLSFLGIPRHFGTSITAGAEVKFMGHLMVFNGLIGICSAAAVHTDSLNNGKLGGENQTDFFDFLNAGAGGTKQWDIILSSGIKKGTWDAPFFIKYAVVDAIYTAQMCIDYGVSWLSIEPIINIILAFSYVLNNIGIDLATHAIVREMIAARKDSLDRFLLKHSGSRGDTKGSLEKSINSLPESVRKTVALDVTAPDFEQILLAKVH